jgi:predicted alpha/beta hydrolase family esterase
MRWVATHGYTVVDQHDWLRPLRGDWLMRLEEAVLEAPGAVALVAHGLFQAHQPITA